MWVHFYKARPNDNKTLIFAIFASKVKKNNIYIFDCTEEKENIYCYSAMFD